MLNHTHRLKKQPVETDSTRRKRFAAPIRVEKDRTMVDGHEKVREELDWKKLADVVQHAGFKNCWLRSGPRDGTPRNFFF